MRTIVLSIAAVVFVSVLTSGSALYAEIKFEKNVSYGPHERNVMDIYWDTDYKDAPIVFTIHGGGFKNGSKAYCNADMQKLFRDKKCVVVSPNYRLKKEGTPVTIKDCAIDCAMAVAYMQANAKKYRGDPTRIVATGGSAGGYLSAAIAYQKKWDWPASAKYKPKKLNIIGWYGDSAYLSPQLMKSVEKNDPSGFMIYGEREHPATPAKLGHQMQAIFKEKGIWNKMVYIKKAGHVPGKKVLISSRSRNKTVFEAFDKFLDMVCYSKGKPMGGDVITIGK
jgi:hypothetical protein